MTNDEIIDKALPNSPSGVLTVPDGNNRVNQYLEWRASLGLRYNQDLDSMEYVIEDGKVVPLALMEVSKVENRIVNVEAYLNKVNENRQCQMLVVAYVARILKIPAWYLLHEDNFERCWIRQLHDGGGPFRETNMGKVERYLRKLREGR